MCFFLRLCLLVGKSFWLGVHKGRTIRYREAIPGYLKILHEEVEMTDKEYSNGELYQEGVDLDFEHSPIRPWSGPCLYMKYIDGHYEVRSSKCDSKRAFFCHRNGKTTIYIN